MKVSIIGGDHLDADGKNSPLVVIDNHAIHVDISGVGQLWDDGETIAQVTWGNIAVDGRIFGTLRLKNGNKRVYYDPLLITPYVKAWNIAAAQFPPTPTKAPAPVERVGHIERR